MRFYQTIMVDGSDGPAWTRAFVVMGLALLSRPIATDWGVAWGAVVSRSVALGSDEREQLIEAASTWLSGNEAATAWPDVCRWLLRSERGRDDPQIARLASAWLATHEPGVDGWLRLLESCVDDERLPAAEREALRQRRDGGA